MAQTAPSQATPGTTAHQTSALATGSAAKAGTPKSAWKDLTPAQQQALKPLAGHWNSLEVERRRKWLVVSKNFPNLPPDEQAKLHSRMSEWASLSQQQRTQARINFSETKKLSPEEKAQKWQAYQALSPEEKKKLAAKAPPKPAGVAVVKPVASPKLADVPVTDVAPVHGSRLAAAKVATDENASQAQQPPAPAEAAPEQLRNRD